jgi:hypothetical protein
MGASSPRLRFRRHLLRLRRLLPPRCPRFPPRFPPYRRRLLPPRRLCQRPHRLRPRPHRRRLLRLRRLRLRHRLRPCRPFPRMRPASPTPAQERKFCTTARTPGYASLRDEIDQRYPFRPSPFLVDWENTSSRRLFAKFFGRAAGRGISLDAGAARGWRYAVPIC